MVGFPENPLLNSAAALGIRPIITRTEHMPGAVARFKAHRLGGNYADVAKAMGAYAERVTRPDELRGALERCIASVDSGRAALLEAVTHGEPTMALP
jgi:thiamine pyrophosphate-dependent acetolactate synthase large subunit-like protein